MDNIIQTSETKLYEVLRDLVGKDKAEEAVLSVKKMINTEVINETKMLATKDDLYQLKDELKDDFREKISRVYKSIYLVGLIQFLAIVGSIIAIIQFALK